MTLRARQAGSADLFALHRLAPDDYPFLLQSVAGHSQSGRYDILFAFPGRVIEAGDGDFFATLSAAARESAAPADELPFAGGWFLLLGYEGARHVERRLRLPPSPFALPDLLAVRCPAAVIVDHERGETHCIAEGGAAQLERLRADLARAKPAPQQEGALVGGLREDSPSRFTEGVCRILDYLAAGDVFQVNLSRAWRGELADGASAADLYARLRISNPAPFAGLARWRGTTVLSSSPERLVQVRGAQVQTRPIAGTRPRGRNAEADRHLQEQLIASVKERAEHIMLIDLERNDLGRVCESGSVEVSELMTVESYAHVHHIVSNVRGRLRPGAGPGEVLRAVFPGGTITGCPKVRAMEIIAELEGEGRGPYTGAMGYLSRDGHMDLNILIRTLVVEGRSVTLRAGAGIVADSRPESELAETRSKARGLLQACGAQA
ncbi:MAG TPA: aminodeoxychorismate synthase component I [Verrucomicrobiae bacterium]|nr:aminodeoxychorismate synthase component I [Verrucomicrobiae bacterium]